MRILQGGGFNKARNKVRYSSERQAVINTCLAMNALGINQGMSGNVSVRTEEGFLVTASGVAYDAMTDEHIVEIANDGWQSDYQPSSEWRMHRDIYRTRAEAGAVVHVHSTYASALSCLREDIPAFHYMIATSGGNTLRCAQYATFGTAELSKNMLAAIEGRRACLLANHGQICFAEDLDSALGLAVEIETLCRQYAIAGQAGEPVILGEGEMGRVLEKFKTYGRPVKNAAEAS